MRSETEIRSELLRLRKEAEVLKARLAARSAVENLTQPVGVEEIEAAFTFGDGFRDDYGRFAGACGCLSKLAWVLQLRSETACELRRKRK